MSDVAFTNPRPVAHPAVHKRSAALMPAPSPWEHAARLLNPTRTPHLAELEADWERWVRQVLGPAVTADFAPHHRLFWEWVWQIRPGERPRPLVNIWSRGAAKSTSAEGGVVALGARRRRRYALYVCSTQDAADQHVANIGAILESKRLADLYPDMADRDVNKFGSSRGWRHNRLAAKSGFTVDALGLDTQVRGVKFDEQRPDLIVIDDIDEAADAPAAIAKKIELLTKAVLPAGSTDLAVLAIQNLIHRDGIFGRMAGVSEEPADFLGDRIMSGPIPAIEALEWVEEVWPSGQARYRITHGTPTWAGMDLAICQAMIDSAEGLTAFLTERQHLAEPPSGGLWKEDFHFAHCNPDDVPELVVVECSVDPAVTDTDHSDRHAIQVDGLAPDGTIYRLHSWEARTSPEDSLRRAIRLALAYGATSVGVETDNGRDTWQSVYRAALAQAQAELADEATADGVEVEPVTWPHYREVLASKALGSKAARAQRMLADYERPGRIVHVRGTHEVLERALRRFPRTKPFDLTDAAYHNWAHLDKRRGGAGRTSARQLARARLPA